MKHIISENLTTLDPTDLADVISKIEAIKTIIGPVTSKIQPCQKKDFQQIGSKLETTIKHTKQAAHDNSDVFPIDYSFDRIDKSIQNYTDFTHLESLLVMLLQTVRETRSVNGIVATDETNIIYDYLQIAAKKNSALKEAMKPIADYYKKGPHKAADNFDIEHQTSITINNVKVKSRFTNTGNTKLSFSPNPELSFRVRGVIEVEPGNSVIIKPGYHAIIIKNEGNTTGSFSVKRNK